MSLTHLEKQRVKLEDKLDLAKKEVVRISDLLVAVNKQIEKEKKICKLIEREARLPL